MEPMRQDTRDVSSVSVSCTSQVDSRDAISPDRWTIFLQLYESVLTHELAQQHPQFTRALRQLERETRLEQERQNAQVLATLRVKDKRISELQKVVSEQREQLDVVLDELERRETKEDKKVQVDEHRTKEDVSVQTDRDETGTKDTETQTEIIEAESGVLELLKKLEKELKTLEQKNLALETKLQLRIPKSEDIKGEGVRTEEDATIESCLEILQQGVDAMTLSCSSCVENPLALVVGMLQGDGNDSATCVNLEHRLEAQAVRLEHVQECWYLWRDAVVQFIKRQNASDHGTGPTISSISPSLIARRDDKEDFGEVNCSTALRGALTQLRQRSCFHDRGRCYDDGKHLLQDLAETLAKGKKGTKVAAKMVQKWAGWEAKHLDEVRALQRDFAEERAVDLSRRTALLKQIDRLEQRELNLQVEVNTLRKKSRPEEAKNDNDFTSFSTSRKSGELLLGTDKSGGAWEYPQLVLRLATVEQSLLAKDEQLTAANATIRALSSCAPTALEVVKCGISAARDGDAMNSLNRLAVELQRASKQKLECLRRREKNLVSMGQYFQMEKSCLQLQSRLEAEQKQIAMLKAAKEVCEQERDELLMRLEKLEMEALLGNFTRRSTTFTLPTDNTPERPYGDALFFALKRLRLLEDDRNVLRDRLRQCQQQVRLMKQQQLKENSRDIVEKQTSILDCVAEHHQKCVSEFKDVLGRQSSSTEGNSVDHGTTTQSQVEWELVLSHYEALWIAFNFLYSIVGRLSPLVETGSIPRVIKSECSSVLRAFGCQVSASVESNPHGNQQPSLELFELELSKREEKILLLQQRLINQDEQLNEDDCCSDRQGESVHPSINAAEYDFRCTSGDSYPVELMYSREDVTKTSEAGRPFLALAKPHKPPLEGDVKSSNGSGNETASVQVSDSKADTKPVMDDRKGICTSTELEECLAKCAYLASQNSKLSRRLRAEKETNQQYLKDQEELRTQLSARTEANLGLQHILEEDTSTSSSRIQPNSSRDDVHPTGNGDADVEVGGKNTSPRDRVNEQEYEALSEQLASREQENLALVQSLCTIKEKCAQMEAIHQKELRVKAAEHAEGMESYMATVNETLSRIESDKQRIEDENVKLRTKLQNLEHESAQQVLELSQRSSKGTNTDSDIQILEPPEFMREKEALTVRVQDLELQLDRERRLTKVVKQKQILENQKDELETVKAKQEYEALRDWRSKLQQEFEEYQAVQRTAQQESGRRIEFLSACVQEFVCLADATPSSVGKTVATKTLYDAVMALARDPGRGVDASSKSQRLQKQNLAASRCHQPSQQSATTEQDDIWDAMLLGGETEQEEPKISEAVWWRLRASKLEAYVRSAMYQNDTFEDTIQQLELRMNNVKEELSTRLAREVQLVSKLAALNSELATTKEQAASLADKYQLASAELEKRQGEATSRGDETQRARMAVQRKTELLSLQKAKVASLQQEHEQAAKKLERLATAEKQAALLQQKAKEHTQQLLHARQTYERCHDDNVQLSLHLEKMKERHAGVLTRLKDARAENAHLRAQCTELKSRAKAEDKGTRVYGYSKDNHHRGNQEEGNAVSIASLAEEARVLKRRVLQKQDVIVSYKAKVTEYETRLERQRETMVKLARTNRDLQQGQLQRQQQEHEFTSTIHAKLEDQLNVKQEQLDGLRASVYDSFEAFVFCQPSLSTTRANSRYSVFPSPESPFTDESLDDEDKLFAIKRWTEFSTQDLDELKLAQVPLRQLHKREREDGRGNSDPVRRKTATTALRGVEGALEANPEDCRAEICELLQCLCG